MLFGSGQLSIVPLIKKFNASGIRQHQGSKGVGAYKLRAATAQTGKLKLTVNDTGKSTKYEATVLVDMIVLFCVKSFADIVVFTFLGTFE